MGIFSWTTTEIWHLADRTLAPIGNALVHHTTMLLRRGVPPLLQRAGVSRRCLCDSAKPLAAQVAQFIGQTQNLESKLAVLEREQLARVLLGLVKSGELSLEKVQARLPEASFEYQDRLPELPGSIDGLRFGLGATVECRMGTEDWARGKVVGHHYRESDWPEGQKAPYQVTPQAALTLSHTFGTPLANRMPVFNAEGVVSSPCCGRGRCCWMATS